MEGPEEGADEFERVAEAEVVCSACGEEEGADACEGDGEDGQPVGFFAPEEEQGDGDEDDVEAGDEACVAGGGVDQPGLLEGAAKEEEEAGNEHPFVLRAGDGGKGYGFDEGEDDEGGKQVACCVELVDASHLSGDALGDEGCAPDDGDEEEGEVGFEAHGVESGKWEVGGGLWGVGSRLWVVILLYSGVVGVVGVVG